MMNLSVDNAGGHGTQEAVAENAIWIQKKHGIGIKLQMQ
jgi:hypothetical protein